MKVTIRNQTDFMAGAVFAGIGLLAVILSKSYPMGTAVNMGPAYFPTILGWLLLGIGGIVGGRALSVKGEPLKLWKIRPLSLVLGAVLAFGYLIEKLGLIIGVVVLVVVSSLARDEFKIREVVILTAALLVLAYLIFIVGLSLPLKLGWT